MGNGCFWIPSNLSPEKVFDAAGFEHAKISGMLLREHEYKEWDRRLPQVQKWTVENVETNVSRSVSVGDEKRYEKCLQSVTSDERVYYLLERHYKLERKDMSVFNLSLTVEIVVHNALLVLSSINPSFVLFGHAPHHFVRVIFAKVAEKLDIDVLIVNDSPLPHRRWLVKGMDRQSPVAMNKQSVKKKVSDKTINFVQQNKGEKKEAMPEYEKVRLQNKNLQNALYYKPGILTFLLACLQETKKVKSVFTKKKPFCLAVKKWSLESFKRKMLAEYNKVVSSNLDLTCNYVVFFCHYQPERTTLPEGLGYAQQWMAIRKLSAAMPTGWKLLVKEHPSMFTKQLLPHIRNSDFYRSISRLPNVEVVPVDYDPYELVDSSKAVSTITGTIGFQALCRGKPVIVFGVAKYRDSPGVCFVQSINDIREAISHIEAGEKSVNDADLLRYCKEVEDRSFPVGECGRCTKPKAIWYSRDCNQCADAAIVVEALKCFS